MHPLPPSGQTHSEPGFPHSLRGILNRRDRETSHLLSQWTGVLPAESRWEENRVGGREEGPPPLPPPPVIRAVIPAVIQSLTQQMTRERAEAAPALGRQMDEAAPSCFPGLGRGVGFLTAYPPGWQQKAEAGMMESPRQAVSQAGLSSLSGCTGALLCHQAVPGHTVPRPLPRACGGLSLWGSG